MGTKSSFPVVKRPGREADHSPPASAEVNLFTFKWFDAVQSEVLTAPLNKFQIAEKFKTGWKGLEKSEEVVKVIVFLRALHVAGYRNRESNERL
jgi:hypothetical protein